MRTLHVRLFTRHSLVRLAVIVAAHWWPCSGDARGLRNAEPRRMLKPLPNGTELDSWGSGRAKDLTRKEPMVYFLFLAVQKVNNMDVWKAFFRNAPKNQYRALVHCKEEDCEDQIKGSVYMTKVPTVPSYYCKDLVSPMQQLIKYSLQLQDSIMTHHPQDKFAFISDSTLPAKPFSEIYATLTARKGSDFCLFPEAEWADVEVPTYMRASLSEPGYEVAPKHHQWIVLNYEHAVKTARLWAEGKHRDFMSDFDINKKVVKANNTFGDGRNTGCLDEFWHMAALYGPLKLPSLHESHLLDLPEFTGGPVHLGDSAGWQGTCDTFVVWSQYLATGGENRFRRLYHSLDKMSKPHDGNKQRPGWWDTISRTGIKAIRESDFLFVRKFIDKPQLVNGGNFAAHYADIVLAA
eukprot:gnl/TRDRNA2_/TRDRNA2_173043_c0_seq1.p1 gnl/TRDRNA2_/TRDRNA2_173043_c0~~gnl/TRDRNA2_/TRDRNA2_173043_c0_seq1.p1  ORF type:complete len:407 (+),score=74.87 gnl/TRDRNA2_/TRDRNA2_173043_c0_seq1:84-1304(+)